LNRTNIQIIVVKDLIRDDDKILHSYIFKKDFNEYVEANFALVKFLNSRISWQIWTC